MEQRGLDINFVIGIFLMLGILMWFNFNQAPTNSESDVINTTTELKPTARDNLPKTDFIKPDLSVLKSEIESYYLSNDYLKIKFSNLGASVQEVIIKNYVTYDSLDLKLINDSDFNFSFFLKNKKINTNQIVFNEVVENNNKISFSFEMKIIIV